MAHTALQIRFSMGKTPEMDILLEGTEAGIDAQTARIGALAEGVRVAESAEDVWRARQEIAEADAVVKVSVLPSKIADMASALERAGGDWRAVVQATGIGWISTEAPLHALRAHIEREGGTLIVLRQRPGQDAIDAWGDAGDALPLMRAIKQRFDPKGTLNPGRFVGGI